MKNKLRKMLSLVLAVVIAMSAISVNTLAAKLIELFNLSPSQSSYLQTGEKGTGLIVSGRKIIPFDRRVPKDSAIYKLCQTDFRREI